MLYLIEHDNNDNPKTRWGQLNGTEEEIIKTLTTFCACIDDISNIFVHDHNGRYYSLEAVCIHYGIPYKKEGD